MIAIGRRNIPFSFLNPNPFLCNSNLHFFPSIQFHSSSRISAIYHVLIHNHQFPPELASLAASRVTKFGTPERADSVLSFLKENSFTTPQLQKLVLYSPLILGHTIERLNSRLKLFQNLGISSEENARIVFSNPTILHSSMSNKIVPSLSILKGLLGSNDDVARLLKKCSWFVTTDLEKTLMPNVEILKSCGVPMERVLHFLHTHPRGFLVKPDILRRSVDKAVKFGVPHTSLAFIRAAIVFNHTSEGMWEVKLQTLRRLGFGDHDILAIFRKQAQVFSASGKKMKEVIEFLLASGRYDTSSIVASPSALVCSIEKRLEPRMQILMLLESRYLIEKWPCLAVVSTLTDARFFDRFVRPHYDAIGDEHITKLFVEGIKK